jgi:hypothetical protein
MTKTDQTLTNVSVAANNAALAAKNASDSALAASHNAEIAAKAAAESATAIAVVATDTSWMKKSLTRVEETLNEMGKSFITYSQHQEVVKSVDDHEVRLNCLETEKTRITLLLSVSGFILTILIGLLVYHLFQS